MDTPDTHEIHIDQEKTQAPTMETASFLTRIKENYKNRKFLVFFLVGVLVFLRILVLFSAPRNFPSGGIVTIASGDSLKSVTTKLTTGGYVRSQMLFITFVTMFGGEHHVSTGDYYFQHPKSVIAVAWQIARGHHDLDPIKVTFPEGKDVREMGDILAAKLPGFDEPTFLEDALPNEGYLFPDTYFLYPKTDPQSVADEMEAMFTTRTDGLFTKAALGGRSEKDIVIMASIIEREAKGDDDRAMISGILWNRINRGIPLEVDASVAYAVGVPEADLTKADLAVDSPYNTYIYRGFPPGPISNPGLEALQAALNPAQTDYLYYLHDSHGTIHYAKTYAEHQANIARYLN